MKLKIQKDQAQKKGLLGGNKGIEFTLSCKAELTSEEMALVEKAKVGEYSLTKYYPIQGESARDLTVDDIIKGIDQRVNNVTLLLELEENIKSGCKNLKSLLEIISSFGGEEIVEF